MCEGVLGFVSWPVCQPPSVVCAAGVPLIQDRGAWEGGEGAGRVHTLGATQRHWNEQKQSRALLSLAWRPLNDFVLLSI